MRLVIASDHAAVTLRMQLVETLRSWGHEVVDLGCEADRRVDYPDYAATACDRVLSGQADRAVLVCGTGIGMSIAANKVAGIRAALVHDVTTAALAAQHNNANVLCLGGRVLGPVTCEQCLEAWLSTEFETRHQHRLDKITAMESSL
ncbi:MAG TPA: ribose 5-phosphate isomerase B [Myxococcales bacterium]|nr:ribose 5-phosphate isomerase B [Myxococcales bacterium]HAN31402.1 ribose 5-phosphate isomerase B [Myxococcales bacterium]